AQATSKRVNALYGATALDLTRQGVYHVEGGIGNIAQTLADKVCELGGQIYYRHFVTKIAIENGRALGVYAKKGRRATQNVLFPADFVVANTTPWSLESLLGEQAPRSLKREIQGREATYGAFVLHLGVRADGLPQDTADHHQIVRTIDGPMGEGETLFLSMSPEWDTARAPNGMRAVTVSTHTRIDRWWKLLETDYQAYQNAKHKMAETIINRIDEVILGFKAATELILPGSPVT
ncbi:MAG: hypothetical protein KC708_26570, partial [Anaerolineae bacterium]|nr:hypothetical protein [Anaerolineae bacterium]